MIKTLTIAIAALAVLAAPAVAKQEKQITRTVWEISDFPDLEKKANAVCASKAQLSDKLKTACTAHQWPSVTKAGAFRNAGIGAELNTLMRQGN